MSRQSLDVVVVGAGFAGMYLLHRLRGMGFSVRVVEAGAGVGGTWYWNRYPGARVDIESMQYSYQFDDALQQEWEWTEKYSPQPELLKYAEHVADRFDLCRNITFNTRITSAVYDEAESRWTLTSQQGEVLSARFCIMATGCLSSPNWPRFKGLERFSGAVYHTAEWPHEPVSFKGQRVALIGTGSSAIQSLPVIAAEASRVTVFQRTPNYSIPAHNAPTDKARVAAVKADYKSLRARAKQNFPAIDGDYNKVSALDVSAQEREAIFEQRWQVGGLMFSGAFGDLLQNSDSNDHAAEFVRNKIRATVNDSDVAEQLCPENIIGGKRLCVDTNYYATYNEEHVELVSVKDDPIEKITSQGIVAHGREFPVDAIVMATGFDAMTGALTKVDIRGRNDASLKDRWAHGPSSYLGLAMADFPNLFTVTGPGSPSVFTNMLPSIEQHVEWITDCLNYARTNNYSSIEAEHEAENAWWSHCQEVVTTGLKSTTNSWYLGANVEGKARVFMPYFGGFPAYCEKCEDVVANDYEGFLMS